jgi:hypothetical protein
LIGIVWFPCKFGECFFEATLLASSKIIVGDVPCKLVEKL